EHRPGLIPRDQPAVLETEQVDGVRRTEDQLPVGIACQRAFFQGLLDPLEVHGRVVFLAAESDDCGHDRVICKGYLGRLLRCAGSEETADELSNLLRGRVANS